MTSIGLSFKHRVNQYSKHLQNLKAAHYLKRITDVAVFHAREARRLCMIGVRMGSPGLRLTGAIECGNLRFSRVVCGWHWLVGNRAMAGMRREMLREN